MDEVKLGSNCRPCSIYITLQDQKLASNASNSRPLRRSISKTHSTHLHFVVHHDQHWAAVQLSMSPFYIADFPGQVFYGCHFRYTLCCLESAVIPLDSISDAVQRIYDLYYQPTLWDFSNETSNTCDPISDVQDRCATKAEKAVLGYQRRAQGPIEELHSGNDAQDNDSDNKKISSLTRKIRNGLKMKITKKQLQSRSTDAATVAGSEFSSWLANYEQDKNPSLSLETFLWNQASALDADAQEMAWKYRFLASCLRNIQGTQAHTYTMWRWRRASCIVNSVVTGLWEAWGPKAALVYEALAVKNYMLTDLSSISEKRQNWIISSVIANLSKECPPDISADDLVLHPAACLSAALKIEYKKVCDKLNLPCFARLKPPTAIFGMQVSISSLVWSAIGCLPLLLYSLGQVREDTLLRGLLLQKRWDDCGNVEEISIHDSGLNEQITSLFSSRTKLDEAISSNWQLGLVRNVLEDGSLIYSISDSLRQQISQSFNCEELYLIGLMFTTHVFPRDQTLEPSFHNVGKLLLPHLEHAWQCLHVEPGSSPVSIRGNLVEAFLATCILVGVNRTVDVISVLDKVQGSDLPNYLQMAIATRKSISLRLKGDHDKSDVVIQDILEHVDLDPADTRLHCSFGRLVFSRAENAILRNEFTKAESYLASWDVKSSLPSGLELQAVRLKNTVIGRVSRYNGQFKHARYSLEECLVTMSDDTYRYDSSRYHVMHHLGDIYCELRIPSDAQNLVLEEVQKLRSHGRQSSKPFRRLALPLSEAYIEQRMLESATSVLRELANVYNAMPNLDVADQVGHVRTMISLARVEWYKEQWQGSRQILQNVFALIQKYATFETGGFYEGFIYLFLSAVNFQLLDYQVAHTAGSLAKDIFDKQGPRHFIPGIGSYFLQELTVSQKKLAQCR